VEAERVLPATPAKGRKCNESPDTPIHAEGHNDGVADTTPDRREFPTHAESHNDGVADTTPGRREFPIHAESHNDSVADTTPDRREFPIHAESQGRLQPAGQCPRLQPGESKTHHPSFFPFWCSRLPAGFPRWSL